MPASEVIPLVPASVLRPFRSSSRVMRIDLPTPPIGGKAWVLDVKGLFVLETGAGTLRTVACTHIGSGQLSIHNGVPDEEGNFPPPPSGNEITEYPGRPLFRANPVVMGSWMMDAGFTNGLTVRCSGGSAHTAPVMTIVWLPHGKK